MIFSAEMRECFKKYLRRNGIVLKDLPEKANDERMARIIVKANIDNPLNSELINIVFGYVWAKTNDEEQAAKEADELKSWLIELKHKILDEQKMLRTFISNIEKPE